LSLTFILGKDIFSGILDIICSFGLTFILGWGGVNDLSDETAAALSPNINLFEMKTQIN
jgi:hypothetical protein